MNDLLYTLKHRNLAIFSIDYQKHILKTTRARQNSLMINKPNLNLKIIWIHGS